MAVLAADTFVPHFGNPTKIVVTSTAVADTFYKGALVYSDTSGGTGLAQVGSLAAGDRIIGICAEQTTVTSAGGHVPIYVDGVFSFPALTGVTGADIGDWIFMDVSAAITDNPADCLAEGDTATAVNDCMVGLMIAYIDSRPVIKFVGGWIKGTDATTVCWI